MTTSFLSVHAGQLHGNDLQALRDFAADAPWEWRKALTALVEAAEEKNKLEEQLSFDLEATTEALNTLKDEVRDVMKTLKKELELVDLNNTRPLIELRSTLETSFLELTEAATNAVPVLFDPENSWPVTTLP